MGVRPRFFTRLGELRPVIEDEFDEDSDGKSVKLPDGWTADYWLGRPVWHRMCSYKDLCDGSLNMVDLMDMHRSINLREYLESKSRKPKD